MKNITLSATAAAVLLLSQPVLAGTWSVGVNLGQSSSDAVETQCNNIERDFFQSRFPATQFSCTSDDSDTAVGVNLGYHFDNTWGVEFGYMDFGEYTANVRGDGTGTFRTTGTNDALPLSLEASALYLAGTASAAISDKWSLTGRLGVAQVDADFLSQQFGFANSGDNTGLMAGVSLDYQIQKQWNAVVRYDYFELAPDFDRSSRLDIDTNIDVLSLGVSHSF